MSSGRTLRTTPARQARQTKKTQRLKEDIASVLASIQNALPQGTLGGVTLPASYDTYNFIFENYYALRREKSEQRKDLEERLKASEDLLAELITTINNDVQRHRDREQAMELALGISMDLSLPVESKLDSELAQYNAKLAEFQDNYDRDNLSNFSLRALGELEEIYTNLNELETVFNQQASEADRNQTKSQTPIQKLELPTLDQYDAESMGGRSGRNRQNPEDPDGTLELFVVPTTTDLKKSIAYWMAEDERIPWGFLDFYTNYLYTAKRTDDKQHFRGTQLKRLFAEYLNTRRVQEKFLLNIGRQDDPEAVTEEKMLAKYQQVDLVTLLRQFGFQFKAFKTEERYSARNSWYLPFLRKVKDMTMQRYRIATIEASRMTAGIAAEIVIDQEQKLKGLNKQIMDLLEKINELQSEANRQVEFQKDLENRLLTLGNLVKDKQIQNELAVELIGEIYQMTTGNELFEQAPVLETSARRPPLSTPDLTRPPPTSEKQLGVATNAVANSAKNLLLLIRDQSKKLKPHNKDKQKVLATGDSKSWDAMSIIVRAMNDRRAYIEVNEDEKSESDEDDSWKASVVGRNLNEFKGLCTNMDCSNKALHTCKGCESARYCSDKCYKADYVRTDGKVPHRLVCKKRQFDKAFKTVDDLARNNPQLTSSFATQLAQFTASLNKPK